MNHARANTIRHIYTYSRRSRGVARAIYTADLAPAHCTYIHSAENGSYAERINIHHGIATAVAVCVDACAGVDLLCSSEKAVKKAAAHKQRGNALYEGDPFPREPGNFH